MIIFVDTLYGNCCKMAAKNANITILTIGEKQRIKIE